MREGCNEGKGRIGGYDLIKKLVTDGCVGEGFFMKKKFKRRISIRGLHQIHQCVDVQLRNKEKKSRPTISVKKRLQMEMKQDK